MVKMYYQVNSQVTSNFMVFCGRLLAKQNFILWNDLLLSHGAIGLLRPKRLCYYHFNHWKCYIVTLDNRSQIGSGLFHKWEMGSFVTLWQMWNKSYSKSWTILALGKELSTFLMGVVLKRFAAYQSVTLTSVWWI